VSPFTIAKLALMLVAAILFAWGVSSDNAGIRWVGIGFLFIALILRFIKPRKPRKPPGVV
jgi:hypothetical protein